MIADSFHNRRNAGIPHAEPFSGNAADIRFAVHSPIERDIADDDVFLRQKAGFFRRNNNNLAARKAFADIVVAFARQTERYTIGQERAEALSGRADKIKRDAVLR